MRILAIILNALVTCLLVLVALGAGQGAVLFLPVFLLPLLALLVHTQRWFAYLVFGVNLLAVAIITIAFGIWAGASVGGALPADAPNGIVLALSVLVICSVPTLNMLSLSAKYQLFRKAQVVTAP
jgi:hypothetical protein